MLSGAPGQRRLPKAEPQPIGLPQKLVFIGGAAGEAWDQVLAAMPPGFFTANAAILAVLCSALALHCEAAGGDSEAWNEAGGAGPNVASGGR